jgi:hypothetical protein
LQTAIEYKVEWDKELDRRKRAGIIDAPEPLPHPDDVVIDIKTGGVRITGPMTKEEKPYWDELRTRKTDNEKEIAELEKILRDEQGSPYSDLILQDLEHARRIRALIGKVVPG